MTKIQATMDSTNFQASLYTMVGSLVVVLFNHSGAGIPDSAIEGTVASIRDQDWIALVLIALPNIIAPISKTIKKGGIDIVSTFMESGNFRTQVAALITLILTAWGVAVDDGSVAAFLESIPGGSLTTITTAFAMHFGNSILHWFELKIFKR